MNILFALLRKEFKQIIRNKAILRVIFILPAVQLLILPFAADYEIKNINVGIIDHDHSGYSQEIVQKVEYSNYFKLTGYSNSYSEALTWIEDKSVDLVIEIPYNFESNLVKENAADVLVSVNAVDGTKGSIGAAYIGNIIQEVNNEIRGEWTVFPRFNPQARIQITHSKWYNRTSDYQVFMVPGVLAMLLTIVGAFLASLNIVKEGEVGTIEQINVSPIRKHEFILGKLIPFWIFGLIILAIGLLISYVVHGIVPGNNIWVLFVFAAVYLLAVLGFGLLVSNFTETQQQAMIISFFFMLIFVLLSGLFTPVESMPRWAQILAAINPVTYLVDVMRMVLLKEAQLADILPHIYTISLEGVVLNTLAVVSYQDVRYVV
ncbi:MAG: ABC transporter permease [Saprospiraceae bacterium]|nr:ABC transporter permease [Saprospiraceae bacterium]